MEYVSQVLLEVNGQEITDFNSVTEGEVEIRKEVTLMNKIGVVGMVAKYPLSLDYVIPKDTDEFDFEAVVNGTITIDYDNGVRHVYSGVYVTKIGAAQFRTGEETVKTIDFIAMRRSV